MIFSKPIVLRGSLSRGRLRASGHIGSMPAEQARANTSAKWESALLERAVWPALEGGKEHMGVPCNLSAIVSEVVEYQCRVASACTIQLLIPCEQTVLLLADPDRIEQVVTNYLTNALNYSAAERPIEIRLQVEERLACVSVRDERPGISPSEQGHIWESSTECGAPVSKTGRQWG